MSNKKESSSQLSTHENTQRDLNPEEKTALESLLSLRFHGDRLAKNVHNPFLNYKAHYIFDPKKGLLEFELKPKKKELSEPEIKKKRYGDMISQRKAREKRKRIRSLLEETLGPERVKKIQSELQDIYKKPHSEDKKEESTRYYRKQREYLKRLQEEASKLRNPQEVIPTNELTETAKIIYQKPDSHQKD